MTEIPESLSREGQPEPTLAEIAFRVGSPSEWEGLDPEDYKGPESIWAICDRICLALGMSHYTDEMKEVAKIEVDRQNALYAVYRRELRLQQEHEELRLRMGEIANKLVDAIVPEDDPRDRETIVDSVIDALKPLDDRLVRAEWNGLIG